MQSYRHLEEVMEGRPLIFDIKEYTWNSNKLKKYANFCMEKTL